MHASQQQREPLNEVQIGALVTRFQEAIASHNPRRALYVAVSGLVGEELGRELAISDPDTGVTLGCLLPPWQRAALSLTSRGAHLHKDVLTDWASVDSLRKELKEGTIAAPISECEDNLPVHSTSPQLYRVPSDKTPHENLGGQFEAALNERNPRRALYVAVSGLLGTNLDYELAISDPDTGVTLGCLLPPWQRAALSLTSRGAHLHKERSNRLGEC